MNSLTELVLKLIRETGLKKPNHKQSWVELARQMNDDLFMYGTCMAWKVSSEFGSVVEIWRLDPYHAVPHPDGYYMVHKTIPEMHFNIPTSQIVRVQADNSTHKQIIEAAPV